MNNETQGKVPLARKAKLVGLGAGLGLVIGAAGAGKLYLDMSETLEAEQARVSQARQEAASLTDQLSAAQTRHALFRARIALAQAIGALSDMNFGSANNQLSDARSWLAKTDPTLAGVDADQLQALRADTKDEIVAAADAGPQLQRLRGLADRLDALLR